MYVWHSGHHVTEPAWVLRLLTGVFDFARIVSSLKDLLSGIAKWIICFMMYAVIIMFMMCHSSKFYLSNDSYMYVCIWFVFLNVIVVARRIRTTRKSCIIFKFICMYFIFTKPCVWCIDAVARCIWSTERSCCSQDNTIKRVRIDVHPELIWLLYLYVFTCIRLVWQEFE